MYKKLLFGITVIVVAVFLVDVSGSYLRSEAISQDNVISTGTLEVFLSDENETQQVTIGNSWGHLESTAGEALAETEIRITNNGTINANHLDIQFIVDGDMDLAKHIFFKQENGLLLGSSKTISTNLVDNLQGILSSQYRIDNPIGVGTNQIDGNDGTTPDGNISLSELHSAGKIRIRPLNEGTPMQAGSTASLWLNAYIDPLLDRGGQLVNTTLNFSLEQ